MTRMLFLALRLAAVPVLIAFVIVMETHRSQDYFRLLSIILVLFLFVDLASLARGKLRDLLLIGVSLAFGAGVIEGIAYLIEPKQIIASTDGYTVRRPVIGWGPEHPGRFHSEKMDPKTGATIYSVDYTIDANLLRRTDSICLTLNVSHEKNAKAFYSKAGYCVRSCYDTIYLQTAQ